ncbi:hypothetical protein CCC_00705 [Paramagnetospirillum magnetotacticum MS-1]|uniref:Uncharacterized protein n=1 Tax=Paramagnetospirillum magnetotacticum MS-1 TaxID=272627 RepID=A0A0C2YD79_PARME|nr:hypothetical protein CCC_00705 [Paramagnetospirillum magnetotacticum MS-1]
MLTRMIIHGLLAAMIVAGGAYAYASTVQPVSISFHQERH